LLHRFLLTLWVFTFALVNCKPVKNFCNNINGRLEITHTNISSKTLVDCFKKIQYDEIKATYTELQDINTPRGTFGKIYQHHLQRLTLLDLSYNKLKSLGASIFLGANHLQTLNLSHNEINTIHIAAFHNLTELKVLDLSHNRLETMYWQSINFTLKGLYLSHNEHLTHIQKITPMLSLETLHLANTSLVNIICFSKMQNLIDLDLSHNSKFEINTYTLLSLMENLTSLRLAGVEKMVFKNIKKDKTYMINLINFPVLKQLKTFDISGNGLEKLASHELINDRFPNLEELVLYGNSFLKNFAVDFSKNNYTFNVICKLNSINCPYKNLKLID
jgi:Leucine-rich repeat (LRR) protein